MKKRYFDSYIDNLQVGFYTLNQLYEDFKYFCEQNVLPCSSKAIFRSQFEDFSQAYKNITINYEPNSIKIKSIIIGPKL